MDYWQDRITQQRTNPDSQQVALWGIEILGASMESLGIVAVCVSGRDMPVGWRVKGYMNTIT